jgi:hypothetical protein
VTSDESHGKLDESFVDPFWVLSQYSVIRLFTVLLRRNSLHDIPLVPISEAILRMRCPAGLGVN